MPKKTLPLTDAAIRNAKPQGKAFKLADGGGLYLEVLPTGGKSWRLKYRFGGQEKRLVFGLWPDVSLKQARERRDAARALVADGVDPGEKRKQDDANKAQEEAAKAATFEVVARERHTKQVRAWSEGNPGNYPREQVHMVAQGGIGRVSATCPHRHALRGLEGIGHRRAGGEPEQKGCP